MIFPSGAKPQPPTGRFCCERFSNAYLVKFCLSKSQNFVLPESFSQLYSTVLFCSIHVKCKALTNGNVDCDQTFLHLTGDGALCGCVGPPCVRHSELLIHIRHGSRQFLIKNAFFGEVKCVYFSCWLKHLPRGVVNGSTVPLSLVSRDFCSARNFFS